MSTITHALTYQYMGAAVWVWLVTLGALPIVNELVNRSQKVTAGSLMQAVGNAVKASPLYMVPIIKQIANVMCTPPPDPMPLPDTKAGEIAVK